MKPLTVKIYIFIFLWAVYLGQGLVSFLAKKVNSDSYNELIKIASGHQDLKIASECYTQAFKAASQSSAPIIDLTQKVERIKLTRSILYFTGLSIWFYVWSLAIYSFLRRKMIDA